jgi:flagellar protein FlgJ
MSEIDLNGALAAPAQAVDEAVKPADPQYRQKVGQAAVKFEGLFIGQMLHEMRKSTRELSADDGIFKDRIDGGMLDYADTQLADSLASQRAFGIADVLVRQLLPDTAAKKG